LLKKQAKTSFLHSEGFVPSKKRLDVGNALLTRSKSVFNEEAFQAKNMYGIF